MVAVSGCLNLIGTLMEPRSCCDSIYVGLSRLFFTTNPFSVSSCSLSQQIFDSSVQFASYFQRRAIPIWG
jgi:hypothetical protein